MNDAFGPKKPMVVGLQFTASGVRKKRRRDRTVLQIKARSSRVKTEMLNRDKKFFVTKCLAMRVSGGRCTCSTRDDGCARHTDAGDATWSKHQCRRTRRVDEEGPSGGPEKRSNRKLLSITQ
jgi:hypothetical protein